MTNIIALQTQTENPKDAQIFTIADDQTTSGDLSNKSPGSSKIHLLDQNIIMGTGSRNYIMKYIFELKEKKFNGDVDELTNSIIEISKSDYDSIPKEEMLNDNISLEYITAGTSNNIPKINIITVFDNKFRNRNVFSNQQSAVLGSGSSFAVPANNRDCEIGQITDRTQLEELALNTYNLSMTAAQSISVSTNLSFGIVHGEKARVIHHPSIYIDPQFINDYVKHLLSVDLKLKPNKITKKQYALTTNINSILTEFYNSFLTDIGRFHGRDISVNKYCSGLKAGKVSMRKIKEAISLRNQQKEYFAEALEAFKSGDLDTIKKYIDNHNQRVSESYDKIKEFTSV